MNTVIEVLRIVDDINRRKSLAGSVFLVVFGGDFEWNSCDGIKCQRVLKSSVSDAHLNLKMDFPGRQSIISCIMSFGKLWFSLPSSSLPLRSLSRFIIFCFWRWWKKPKAAEENKIHLQPLLFKWFIKKKNPCKANN